MAAARSLTSVPSPPWAARANGLVASDGSPPPTMKRLPVTVPAASGPDAMIWVRSRADGPNWTKSAALVASLTFDPGRSCPRSL